jgi:hypothetical protein
MPVHGDDDDVEVSSGTVEIDVDMDEPLLEASDEVTVSEGPSTQPHVPPEAPEEVFAAETFEEAETGVLPSVAPVENKDSDVPPTLANEVPSMPPSSSRRPIASEELAASAYDGIHAPLLTPPPESGKQVASASVHLAHPASDAPTDAWEVSDEVVTSVPGTPRGTPALELVGGWHEPGLDGASPSPEVRVTPMPERPVAPAEVSGTRLSPDVTRVDFDEHGDIALFEQAFAIPKPSTMGELLDLTLSL